MIVNIRDDNEKLLAKFVFRGNRTPPGVTFCTEPEHAIQVGTLSHPAGRKIQAHLHNPVPRNTVGNQEVLFLMRGDLQVHIYDSNKKHVSTMVLHEGDFVILLSGGHAFEALTNVEVFEVKQGPYVGEADKERF